MNKLVLIGSLLLGATMFTSCGGGGTTDTKPPQGSGEEVLPPVTPTLKTLSISGQLTEDPEGQAVVWKDGAGTVTPVLQGSTMTFAPVALKADGTFTLKLDQALTESQLPAKPLFPDGFTLCDDPALNKITVSTPAALGAGMEFKLKSTTIDRAMYNANGFSSAPTATTPGTYAMRVGLVIYSNAENTVIASPTCLLQGNLTQFKVNLKLVKGWNSVVSVWSGELKANTTRTITIEAGPLFSNWVPGNAPPISRPNP